jgi:hypothetical protein
MVYGTVPSANVSDLWLMTWQNRSGCYGLIGSVL